MTRRLRLPLHPFERLTYGATLAVVAYLRWRGLRMDWRTVEYMAGPMFAQLPRALAVGLALHAVALALGRESPRGWLRAVATPASALLWLRVWVASMTVTYTYSWLKVAVPLLRWEVLDPALWKLDRLLHFGVSPSIFAVELVGGTAVAGWLDVWYSWWITTVVGMFAFAFLSPSLPRRRNFALACAVLWIGGATLYFALPAVGPCYASEEVFRELRAEMPRAASSQAELWRNYVQLVAGRDGSLKQFKPYLGVAALPSLHVGAHVLFALWARRHARRLALPFAAAALLTFLASIATGWHYAVDGYLGALLAVAALWLAERLEPVPEDAAGGASAAPPLGGEGARQQQAGDQRDGDQEHAEGGVDAEHDVALDERGQALVADAPRHQEQDRRH